MSYHNPRKPSQELLDHLTSNYTYDREKGQIINNRRGTPSLLAMSSGYLRVQTWINGVRAAFKTHHVVWFFEYGEWPTSCMDHIDGTKNNNHYTNLRLVTSRENSNAYRMSAKSSSPYQGVSKNTGRETFYTRIRVGEDSKQIYLGSFSCELEAARAYDKSLVGMGLKPVNVEIMKELQKDD